MATSPFGVAAEARPAGSRPAAATPAASAPPGRRNVPRAVSFRRPAASSSAPSASKASSLEMSMGGLLGLDEAGGLDRVEHLGHRLRRAERGRRGDVALAGPDDVPHPGGVTRLDGEDRSGRGEDRAGLDPRRLALIRSDAGVLQRLLRL